MPTTATDVTDADPFSRAKDNTRINNLLIAFSTIDPYVSNRSQTEGSWYFNALEKVFSNPALTDSLEIRKLLDETDKELSTIVRNVKQVDGDIVRSCQTSEYHVIGMRKDFYLPLSNN